jgi:hypothetical protein
MGDRSSETIKGDRSFVLGDRSSETRKGDRYEFWWGVSHRLVFVEHS